MKMEKDAQFWDRGAARYARAAIGDSVGYERTLARTRGLLRADAHVLELGCGTGTTALALADGVQTFLATDFSAAMIDLAKAKASGIAGLTFATATAETLVSEPSRFDAVLGFNYLHLVRDLHATLRQAHELLRGTGLFISKTPCLGDMNPLIRLALLLAMRALGRAPYVNGFGAAELVRHIEAAGFDVLAVEYHAERGRDTRPYIVAAKKP
jgi:ubiquinone/menaquinone biosynthesis C-methylase UbiE